MIIVTGGAGMIGSAIVWELNQQGITDIIIVDNLNTSDKWKNLVRLKYKDYYHKNQFIDLIQSSDHSFNDAEAIIHMGACSATTEDDMDYLFFNNLEYTKILATWSLSHRIRFIYASSAATYGEGNHGFGDNDDTLSQLVPINRYAYSKSLFDEWAKRKNYLSQITGLKFFNVYGPNEYHKGSMKSVMCKSFSLVKETGKLSLFKSYRPDYHHGEQKRDFVYVKDCAKVVVWLLQNADVNGLFNCGSGQARSWNDVANALFKAMGEKPKIDYIDMPDSLQGQYQYFTEAPMDKLRKAGYTDPFYTLEDGIEDYVQSYLEHGAYLGSHHA